MSTIQKLSQQCLRSFQDLVSRLKTGRPEFRDLMPSSTIESELGKLRVWCGNLGALQTGYASLDYRLRESEVMQTNIVKLLQQLSSSLKESIDVVSGSRLPFEEQSTPSDLSEDSTDESDLGSEQPSGNELSIRLSSIIDIHTNLYQLGYKIRDPSLRPISSKVASLQEIDEETKIDLFDRLSQLDKTALTELLASLRCGRPAPDDSYDFLAERLATSITLRRKYFRYWKKHARKLDQRPDSIKPVQQMVQVDLSDMSGAGNRPETIRKQSSSFLTPSTILSNTDATPYDPMLDDQTEKESIVSLASTAVDADGKGVSIPKAPVEAIEGHPFTCPYCAVLCPPRQGRGKAWKAHFLHDLQPYVCTYEGCTRGNELYRSRRQWLEHEELAHRCGWRCRDHPDTLYISAHDFQSHLVRDHSSSVSSEQMDEITHISVVGCADERQTCPICFEQQPFPNGLTNHLANHLERIAFFALPMPGPEESDSWNQSRSSMQIFIGSRGSSDLAEPAPLLDDEVYTGSLEESSWEWPPDLGLEPTTNFILKKKLRPLARDLARLSAGLQISHSQLSDHDKAIIKSAKLSVQRCITLTELLREIRLLELLVENLQAQWDGPLDQHHFSSPESTGSIPAISAFGAIGACRDILDGSVDAVSGGLETGARKMDQSQDMIDKIWPSTFIKLDQTYRTSPTSAVDIEKSDPPLQDLLPTTPTDSSMEK
ncbi:CAMK kinase [Fusarium albosuccineum]|uniref:CAMK kinase n=1 Tax=Fusarium albosuccineum TaxID=1237068 RepID=A0A8H4KZA3_9HYPO|nr:CAMK kinase [Fusarium albosuccineum]